MTGSSAKYDIIVNVHGGGFTGQAGAIRHGISRALVLADEDTKAALKKAGFLTRDPRAKKERSTVSKRQEERRSSQRDNVKYANTKPRFSVAFVNSFDII